jgi:hypothetical protein
MAFLLCILLAFNFNTCNLYLLLSNLIISRHLYLSEKKIGALIQNGHLLQSARSESSTFKTLNGHLLELERSESSLTYVSLFSSTFKTLNGHHLQSTRSESYLT